MNADDRALAIAARIADGSGIDWPADGTGANSLDPAMLEELKAINRLATLHRAPHESGGDATVAEVPRWGPLALLEQIGEGRFGQIYRAWDARLQRHVALKLLHASSPAAASPTHAIEEARLLARVRHPNVLTVHGAEYLNDQVGIWTEFIEGRTLEALLAERGPLPPDEVVAIGLDLCRALGAVHEAGLLHRDVKLQNVMRETGGRIVLMDFGAGHDLERVPARAGDLTGTPLYLAPEIFRGAQPTQASDSYALAVLLFRLLTGAYPVAGNTLDDVRASHQEGVATQLSNLRPELPARLIEAIERGLGPDPSRRYESTGAFEAALMLARDSARATIASPRPMRQRARILAWVIAVAIVAATGAWALNLWDVPRHDAPRVVRTIRLPQSLMGRPSRDGRFLPYVDAHGGLRIWNTSTGQSVLAIERGTAGESIGSSLMSPDGDQVAYAWSAGDEGWELRSVHVDGTGPRVLIGRETAFTPVPVDWSRDGQAILCQLLQKDRTVDLVLVPTGGGRPKVLQTSQNGTPESASLSPDGRWVAYYRRPAPAAPRRLFIVGVDGSAPRVLADASPTDSSPLWTADGRNVFFMRTSPIGSNDGWMLPVVNGVAQGDSRLVFSNLGPATGAAITDSGALLYELSRTAPAEVYTARFDLTGDSPPGPPTRISAATIGEHITPAWSPDGTSIAYMTRRENPLHGGVPLKTLTIQDVQTGKTKDASARLPFLGGYSPRWSHDGRSVIVWGGNLETQEFGYFRINVETGETSTVMLVNKSGNEGYFQNSPDGREFVYVDSRGIVARDFVTSAERVIVARGKRSGLGPFGFSPNGQSVAFIGRAAEDGRSILTLEVQTMGGRPRELVKATQSESLIFQTWTPDSQDVLYTKWTGGDTAPSPLWRIAATGGQPRDMHFAIEGNVTNQMSLSPDGRLAYTERDVSWELWIREHILPAAEGKARRR